MFLRHLDKLLKYLKSILRLLQWLFQAIPLSKNLKFNLNKRILAIWDLQTVPYSVGDILVLNEAMMCLRIDYNADKIDICFVCDPQKPSRQDFNSINSENYHYNLAALIPLVQINPHLGSFILFDSYVSLEKFITDNIESYYVWPSIRHYANKIEAYANNFDYVQQFYSHKKYIPYLSCLRLVIEWAYKFYKQNLNSQFPIVVHLRNSKNEPERNSKIDEWIAFFEFCNNKYPIKFLIICSADEIDNRLRDYSNVMIMKDWYTTVEQDLSLIESSVMFMGGPSGPSTMALFQEVPYIIFNFRPSNETITKGSNLMFANNLQRLIWEPETKEILSTEFLEIFSKIDLSKWEDKKQQFLSIRSVETRFRIGSSFRV